jgi:hypothetical protein
MTREERIQREEERELAKEEAKHLADEVEVMRLMAPERGPASLRCISGGLSR